MIESKQEYDNCNKCLNYALLSETQWGLICKTCEIKLTDGKIGQKTNLFNFKK